MKRWLQRLAPVLAGVAIGALVMLVGLAQAGRLSPEDPKAVVALAQYVQTAHRKVDLMLEGGDVAGAIEALEEMRTLTWPDRVRGGDIGIELRHDVYGRLIRLRLDNPEVAKIDSAAALALVEEGLGPSALDVDPNPFTARLVAMRGEVLEAAGRDDEALTAYERALDMNRTLLERELGGMAP